MEKAGETRYNEEEDENLLMGKDEGYEKNH